MGGHIGRVLQALDILQTDRPTFRGVHKVEGAIRQAGNAKCGLGSIRLPEPGVNNVKMNILQIRFCFEYNHILCNVESNFATNVEIMTN